MKNASRIAFLVTLFLVAVAESPALATVFIKHGNNGTLSCTVMCNGFYGTSPGTCVFGIRGDTGAVIDCSEAPGFLNGQELTCGCNSTFLKGGNNGTASCDDFCGRAAPGPASQCVRSRRDDTSQELGCGDIPGFLGGPTFECYCHTEAQDQADVQAYHNQIQAQQGNASATYNSLVNQANSLSTQQDQVSGTLQATQRQVADNHAELTRQQGALSQANAQVDARTGALTTAQQRQAAAQTDAQAQAAAAQTASDHLNDVQAQKTAADTSLAKLNAQYAPQAAALADVTAKVTQDAAALAAAQGQAASVPASVKQLVAQTGRIIVGNHNCSGFEVSDHEVRTAWHCVADLPVSALVAGAYIDGSGGSHSLSGISTKDPDHDAAVLIFANADGGFTDFRSAANVNRPVRLISWDYANNVMKLSDPCHILSMDLKSATIIHDCLSAPGSSGGALLQDGSIVGSHVGSLPFGKLATFVIPAGNQPISVTGLTLEYNCASDCRAEAYQDTYYPCPNFTNPGRMCKGQPIFDPTKFSLCETGRNTDCAAQGAAPSAHAALVALGQDAGRVASSVHQLEQQIAAQAQTLDSLNNAVNSLESQLDHARASVSNLAAQAQQTAASVVTATTKLSGIEQAINVADAATQGALAARDAAAKQAADWASQATNVTNLLANVQSSITDLGAKVAAAPGQIAAAASKDLGVRQALAAEHAVLGVGNDVNLSGVTAIALPPQLDHAASKAGDRLSSFGGKLGSIGPAAKSMLQNLAADIGLKIKSTLWRWYQNGSQKVAFLDPTRWTKPKPDTLYAGRLLAVGECLDRAKGAIANYQADVTGLGLAAMTASVQNRTLDKIADASQVIGRDVQDLNQALLEIVTNHCDVSLGIDQPLRANIVDAAAWQQWLIGTRVALTASSN